MRKVRVFSLIVGDLRNQEGWELITLDDQEAEFRWRGEELIFSLQRDGEIEPVGVRKVLRYSWSGQWWSNAGVQRPVGIARLWEAWQDSCVLDREGVLENVQRLFEDGSSLQEEGRLASLRDSILCSMILRGCPNWTLESAVGLRVELPVLRRDVEERPTRVGLNPSEDSLNRFHLILGGSGAEQVAFEELDGATRLRQRVGTTWGFSPQMRSLWSLRGDDMEPR